MSEAELEERGEGDRRCLNCQAPLRGEYCSSCGQRDLPSKLAIGELLREVLSETFELDGRVVRTLVPFLFRPGFLTREFIHGRRVRYTSPFRLFLAATLLWLLTSFIAEQRVDFEEQVGDHNVVRVDTPEPFDNALFALLAERGEKFEELPEAEQARRASAAFRETVPTAALLTIPIFALVMKLLFVRKRRFYVEHLVFALHVHAFAFTLMAIAALFSDDLVGVLAMVLVAAYAYVALWRAYEARWWTSALRLVALGFCHAVVLMIVTGLMVIGTVLLG